MDNLKSMKEFWQTVEKIMNESPEYKLNLWLAVVERYKFGEYKIEVVQILAELLGGKNGEAWFREALPSLPFSQRSLKKSRGKSQDFTNNIRPL